MAEPKVEKTEEQKEIEARKAVKGEKAAKANKKISTILGPFILNLEINKHM